MWLCSEMMVVQLARLFGAKPKSQLITALAHFRLF